MNRSFAVSAGVISTALALVLNTQVSSFAQTTASAADLIAFAKVCASGMAATTKKKRPHRLAIQVNVNDPAVMNLALNNVSNVAQYYKQLGQQVDIEVVAFGPGLHMLRDDTSPVKARIKTMSETMPQLSFAACGNTRDNMAKVEASDIPLISQAKVVKSGVVQLMELQEQGWTYLRP